MPWCYNLNIKVLLNEDNQTKNIVKVLVSKFPELLVSNTSKEWIPPHAIAFNADELPDLSDTICPFCGDNDFDSWGLRLHLLRGHCEVFENLSDPEKKED